MLAKLKQHDWLLTMSLVILSFLSLALIYSTTSDAENSLQGQNIIYKQAIFIFLGLGIYFLISGINITWLQQKGIVVAFYFFSISTLIYVLFFANEIQNTQRWIALGPFSFQPAEFAKIVIVLLTSYLFTYRQTEVGISPKSLWHTKDYGKLLTIAVSFLLNALVFLLVFIQPALGNSLIILIIWMILAFFYAPFSNKTIVTLLIGIIGTLAFFKLFFFADLANGIKLDDMVWKVFILTAVALIYIVLWRLYRYGIALALTIWLIIALSVPVTNFAYNNLLKEYHKERIQSFLNGFNTDPLNKDYQVRQSIIAIGSGQLKGRGYLAATQSKSNVLPYSQTDFIFASLAEQFGFIGVLALFILYGFILLRLIQIFLRTENQFGKFLTVGVISIVFCNIVINIAMNMGLMPVAGVPLPLISYGGSSVLLMFISIGLVQIVNNSIKPKELLIKLNWHK